jgi:hypothetical protein
MEGIRDRLGINEAYVGQGAVANMQAKDRHPGGTRYVSVNLYLAKIFGPLPKVDNQFYQAAETVSRSALRHLKGTCTQLAYNYLEQFH